MLTTVKKDKGENILHTVNNTTKNITFTNEENDNKLAYLDVLLTKTATATETIKSIARKLIQVNY